MGAVVNLDARGDLTPTGLRVTRIGPASTAIYGHRRLTTVHGFPQVTSHLKLLAGPSNSSGGETRTLNLVVNSHPLCRLSYPGKLRPRYHLGREVGPSSWLVPWSGVGAVAAPRRRALSAAQWRGKVATSGAGPVPAPAPCPKCRPNVARTATNRGSMATLHAQFARFGCSVSFWLR